MVDFKIGKVGTCRKLITIRIVQSEEAVVDVLFEYSLEAE